jgi:hypothetical protein
LATYTRSVGDSAAGTVASNRINNELDVVGRLEAEITFLPTCGYLPKKNIGVYVGGYFVKLTLGLETIEKLAASDQITNDFKDRKDPIGGVSSSARTLPT